MNRPTIFALASGSGRAAIAIIRVSGPATRTVLEMLIGAVPRPRQARLASLKDPHSGALLDRALVLWFPAPNSFTGEDAAELHLHGGRAVVEGVLGALGRTPGLRLAEPGEFTRRAFHNGKMDLAEVEGLADLIDAQTEAQRRQALRQLDGVLGRWTADLRENLLAALALAEGAIDFAEEDDLVATFERELLERVASVKQAIDAQMAVAARGERVREGIVVAIAGAPNVGKSTLLNILAGRDAAIVSAVAGTTRDTIEVGLDLAGCAVLLVDTAGLRETADPVEQEGLARARARAGTADLVLWLRDGLAPDVARPQTRGEVWTVATKADRVDAAEVAADHVISARTGAGLDGLIAALTAFAARDLVGGETAVVTRLRHRAALDAAELRLASILKQGDKAFELVAEDIRGTLAALAGLVGRADTEEVLGRIFARFCIGK